MRLLTLVLAFLSAVEGYNILALMTVLSRSHHSWNLVYLKALADRGHRITYISVNEYKNPHPNIRHILIEDAYKVYDYMEFSSIITEMSEKNQYQATIEDTFWYLNASRQEAQTKGMQRLVELTKTEKFDGVVFDLAGMPFYLGSVDALGRPPMIGITAYGIPPWALDNTATPYPVANSPHFTYPLPRDLGFYDRLQNAAFFYFSKFYRQFFIIPEQDKISRSLFGDVRSVADILADINVNMVNANWASENTFPHSPGLIPIGGLHIAKPKPLPQDLQKYLDDSKHGVIYFSFGTNILGSMLEPATIDAFKTAFDKIAPIRVIWKWENDTMPGKPENVLVSKWMPQNDILAHPNVRLFITHGGALGSQEALYHGVPILGVPFFVDQHANVLRAVSSGLGETIVARGLTAEGLLQKINQIVHNPIYKETASRLSKIFRDDLNPPLERAIFWTEYAIRNDGALHLRPPAAGLNWFQSGLWDLILTALCVSYLSFYIIFWGIRFIVKSFSAPAVSGSKKSD